MAMRHSPSVTCGAMPGSISGALLGIFWPRSALWRTLCLSGAAWREFALLFECQPAGRRTSTAMDYDFRTESDTLILPKPNATLDLAMSAGATVCVRRYGNPDGPRLVLSHGNGFAIGGYYSVWRLVLR